MMTRPIRVLLVLVATLALTAVLGACGGGGGDGGGDDSAPSNTPIKGAPEVSVVADNLKFDPDELTVQAGDFNIELTSEDQFHDLEIEDVPGLVEASSGETEVSGFTIDDPGEYTFFCTVPGHRAGGMEGTLTVE
jgi:plastocyanin